MTATTPTNWADAQIADKKVKSCDGRGLGNVKEINGSHVITLKGARLIEIPRAAIATLDKDKLYLRATESEVLAGYYPFIRDEK